MGNDRYTVDIDKGVHYLHMIDDFYDAKYMFIDITIIWMRHQLEMDYQLTVF